MKNKSIITILSLCLGLSMATTSCEDMLNSESDRHSYTVAGDTLYSYWGILKSLQNIGERYVILGECRGDLIDGGSFTTDSVNAILTFGLNDPENFKDGANRYLKVSDYYHVINSCNAYLAQADTVMEKANGDKYMLKEIAQVEAIRAWTYMQLVNNYGDVPYYDTPMLSTSDINNFNSLDSKNRVDATTLWQKLEKYMLKAYQIENQYGYPQYDNYGYTASVCHSSKSMFPTALVLADMYLMGNQFEKAAYYYYEFLSDKEYFGAPLPLNYYSYGYLRQGESEFEGKILGYPWNEKEAMSRNEESITAIPSSTNALWGTVQRGVNDLFGFEASIRQTTGSDSIARASINLTRNWERQLGPSAGYYALCNAQKFEAYLAAKEEDLNGGNHQLIVLESVGDARGLTGKDGVGYISRFGSGDYYVGEEKYENYIMKQNPGIVYSTVFPMVYRRSMVWLRFAEAINRAGYPTFAFAILKNGLTDNASWLPGKWDYLEKSYRVHFEYTSSFVNPEGVSEEKTVVLPEDWESNDVCVITSPMVDEQAFEDGRSKFVNYLIEECNVEEYINDVADIENYTFYKIEERMDTLNDIRSEYFVCDYISYDECERAEGVDWLNFDDVVFSSGTSRLPVAYITTYPMEKTTPFNVISYPSNGTANLTRGIHQKGCGLLKYDEKNSVYNFVDQVNLKLLAAREITEPMTKADMYENITDGKIIRAVEELILDEAALELAFEGNRFPDLMRIALRRQTYGEGTAIEYMKNKLRVRGENTSWVDYLNDIKKCYLPLPDYSNRPQ